MSRWREEECGAAIALSPAPSPTLAAASRRNYFFHLLRVSLYCPSGQVLSWCRVFFHDEAGLRVAIRNLHGPRQEARLRAVLWRGRGGFPHMGEGLVHAGSGSPPEAAGRSDAPVCSTRGCWQGSAAERPMPRSKLSWRGLVAIEIPGQDGFRLHPLSSRHKEWTLTDSVGSQLMRLGRNPSWTSEGATVTLELGSKGTLELPLLLFLSWYLALLVSYDYDTGAIAALIPRCSDLKRITGWWRPQSRWAADPRLWRSS